MSYNIYTGGGTVATAMCFTGGSGGWTLEPGAVSVTAVSIISNVLTVTCGNHFQSSDLFVLNGTAELFLNGQTLTVLSATSTQFTANFTHANYINNADTGTAEFALGTTRQSNNSGTSDSLNIPTVVSSDVIVSFLGLSGNGGTVSFTGATQLDSEFQFTQLVSAYNIPGSAGNHAISASWMITQGDGLQALVFVPASGTPSLAFHAGAVGGGPFSPGGVPSVGDLMVVGSGAGLSVGDGGYNTFTIAPGGTVYYTVVANLPATLTTQSATSITCSTATANGNMTALGSGANATVEGFVYALSDAGDPGNVAPGSSGWFNHQDSSGTFGTGAFSQNLTGLTINTTYFYRPYVQTSAGWSYGGVVSFTTNSVPSVTTQMVSSPTTSTATLNGNITSLSGNPNAAARGFVYGTSDVGNPGNVAPGSSGWTSFTTHSGAFSTGAFTDNVTGLTQLTTYFYRTWAQTACGYAYGNVITFYTGTSSGRGRTAAFFG